MTDMGASPRPGLVAGALFGFVLLGLPEGMLGVAWPVLRHAFGQPLASLGELLLGSLVGYLAVTSITGRALRRLSPVAVLAASAITASGGVLLLVATPAWAGLVLAAVLLGAAGGGVDGALNTVVALAGHARLMNLMHAAFGAGAALGPLLVTAALAAHASWRSAYAVLLPLELGLLAVWIALRRTFPALPHTAAAAGPDGPPRRARGRIGLSLAVFFCYAGLEVSVASWSASFLRGPGLLSPVLAGVAVFAFWLGLMTGRIGAAALGPRLSPAGAAWLGIAGSAAASGLLWTNAAPAATAAALALMGLSLGPIFPALMNLTPSRLGSGAAQSAVGWQLAAAGIGGAGLSALVGLVLQADGLATLGPALLTLAVALGGLNVLLDRVAVPM